MEVKKDMRSSASVMADECCMDAEIDPSLPASTSISEPFQEKVVHYFLK